ncbi:hypothetical protein [Spiroplasma alleghenense]|uniref:Uncharacterized protein n=1 Tax=Spiroplasma alleghenense TaxID=216931 RepID=A0A345Z4P5_9MOLU|nr:hypothetical protein [Spiroplasma alleghenense]AXK51574.1 hypothetical protein SALLE_v1c09040 [Spiroplasma alleghenense]
MTKKEKKKMAFIITAYILGIFMMLLSDIYFQILVDKSIYIKDLPGIEKDFFNGFTLNGEDISNIAVLNSKYLLFPFGGKIFYGGRTLMFCLTTILFWVGVIPLIISHWRDKMIGRKWFWISAIISIFLIIILLVGFALTINKNIFIKVFEVQTYGYFGRDFFNTVELQQQLDILRNSVLEAFGYKKFLGINISYIIIGLLTISAILFCLLQDYLGLRNKENDINALSQNNLLMSDSENQIQDKHPSEMSEADFQKSGLLINEPKFKIKKQYYLSLVWSILILSVLSMIFWSVLFFDSVKIQDIPLVESNYFNGFINQKGEIINDYKFYPNLLFSSYSIGGIIGPTWMFFLTFIPLWILSIMNFFHLRPYKKEVDSHKVFLIHNIICFIFLANIIIQLIFFFSPESYKIAFEDNLFFAFEKNFLIKEVGRENLDYQINNAVHGLKILYEQKLNPIVITLLTISLAAASICIFFITQYFWVRNKNISQKNTKIN